MSRLFEDVLFTCRLVVVAIEGQAWIGYRLIWLENVVVENGDRGLCCRMARVIMSSIMMQVTWLLKCFIDEVLMLTHGVQFLCLS